MSTTAHWKPLKPPEPPAGTLYRLKRLLFDEFGTADIIGADTTVLRGSYEHGKLEGLHGSLPRDDEDKAELRRILDAIREHGGIRVWIDE